MLKLGAKLFLKYALCVLMSFFIFMSCLFIFTTAFSVETGYHVYSVNSETGKAETHLYTYNKADGEDLKYKDYEAQGYKLTKIKTRELSEKHKNVAFVVSLLFTIPLTVGVLYATSYNMGGKDISRVHSGFMAEDKLKGLKVGIIAAMPLIFLYALLLLGKFSIIKPNSLAFYCIANSHLYGIIQFIYKGASLATELGFLQLLLLFIPVLFIPAVAWLGYLLGYKEISITQNLVYKNKSR